MSKQNRKSEPKPKTSPKEKGWRKYSKQLLAILVLAGLFLPLVQTYFPFLPPKPLNGYQPAGDSVLLPLDWQHWKTGAWQHRADSLINADFGLRDHLVRAHNQWRWELFRRHNVQHMIPGKEGYLYTTPYIEEYLGRNRQPEERLARVVQEFQRIRDTLAARHTGFLILIAPGKASYFPEYLPESQRPQEKGPSNYDYFTKALPEAGIPLLDFDAWFRQMKDTTQFPLMPQSGLHWSAYGAWKATDSLCRYLETIRSIDLPEIVLDTLRWSEENLGGDYDIGRTLNLLTQSGTYPMAYPEYHRVYPECRDTLNTLVIGDSFFYGMSNNKIFRKSLGAGNFWYYSQEAWGFPPPPLTDANLIDIKSDIESRDMVIILCTVANLSVVPWGFNERFLAAFDSEEQARIEYYVQKIHQAKEWMEDIRAKAEKRGVPFEEMIRQDAVWLARTDLAARYGKAAGEVENS